MLKIFILSIALCIVAARPGHVTAPGYLPIAPAYDHYDHHYAYAPTVVAHSVEHYPTAVSHQSQTIVHEKRPYLRPILDYASAATYVKSHAPIVTKYVAAAAPAAHYAYAPAPYYNGLYAASGWDSGLAYTTKGWNGWPLK